jgi:hypothetical protein
MNHHNNSWLSQFRSLHPPPNTPNQRTPLWHLLSAKRRHPPAVSSALAANATTRTHSGNQYDNIMVQEAASTLEHILLEIQTDVATLMKDRGENVRKEGNDDESASTATAAAAFVTTNEESVLSRWDISIATVRECIRPLQRYLLHHTNEENDDDDNMYDRWSLLLDEAHMVLWLHPYVTSSSSSSLLLQQQWQNHSVVQCITASIQRTIHTINTTTTMLDLFLYDHHHHLHDVEDDNDDDRNTAAVVITVPTTILELPRVLRQCVVGRQRRRTRSPGNGSFVRQQQQQQQYDILLIYLWCQLATDTMPIATVTPTSSSPTPPPQLEWNEHLYQHILQYTQYRPISSYNTLLQATMAMYQYDQYLLDGRMVLPPPTLSMIQNSFFNLHDKYVFFWWWCMLPHYSSVEMSHGYTIHFQTYLTIFFVDLLSWC